MKYSNVISKLFEPLLITPQRHSALCQLLEARLAQMPVQQDRAEAEPAIPDEDTADADPEDMQTRGVVAVIPVHGTLVQYPEDIAMSECGCDLDGLNAMITAAEEDPRVSALFFDFRTPGGSVVGIPEMGRRILHCRKPTIAFTDSECCSGGIWLASQCSYFYATESSRIGSVGVYTMSMDMSAAMKKDGIKVNAISAGKYKLLGAYWKPLSEDERELIQARVDKIYSQFKQAMENVRIVEDENFGNGLIFDGEEAAQKGFIDAVVSDRQEALQLASELSAR